MYRHFYARLLFQSKLCTALSIAIPNQAHTVVCKFLPDVYDMLNYTGIYWRGFKSNYAEFELSCVARYQYPSQCQVLFCWETKQRCAKTLPAVC